MFRFTALTQGKPRSKITLPLEIFSLIADELVSYNEPDKYRVYDIVEWDIAGTLALAKLSRTCSWLRHIAQPRLFRCLYLNDERYFQAALSLLKHPQLRQYIKRVYFDSCKIHILDCDTVGQTFVEVQDWAKTNTNEFQEIMAGVTMEKPFEEISVKDGEISGMLSPLILALASKNVEFALMDYRAIPQALFTNDMFSSLTFLALETFSIGYTNDLSDLLPIMRAAPNLVSLHSQACGGIGLEMAHPNLQSVEFWYADIGVDCINSAINNMPNLTQLVIVLQCEEDSGWGFEVGKLGDVLLARCANLTYLYFDISESYAYGAEDLDELSFDGLDNLTDLTLNGLTFSNSDTQKLMAMLPASIESLDLACLCENVAPQIKQLLSCAREKFPNLSQLKSSAQKWTAVEKETIEELCRELGITYTESTVRPAEESGRWTDLADFDHHSISRPSTTSWMTLTTTMTPGPV